MKITYDSIKRADTLRCRGLDFADAGSVFSGDHFSIEDDRFDYGETRYQTIGLLGHNLVMVVWTPRGNARRIISMRKCSQSERKEFHNRVG